MFRKRKPKALSCKMYFTKKQLICFFSDYLYSQVKIVRPILIRVFVVWYASQNLLYYNKLY